MDTTDTRRNERTLRFSNIIEKVGDLVEREKIPPTLGPGQTWDDVYEQYELKQADDMRVFVAAMHEQQVHEQQYGQQLSWEIINSNPNQPWDWDEDKLNNNYQNEKSKIEEFMIQEYRKYLAVYRIQTRWRLCRDYPEYKMCERVVMRNMGIIYEEYGKDRTEL